MEEFLHQLIGSLSHYLQGFIHLRWFLSSTVGQFQNLFLPCQTNKNNRKSENIYIYICHSKIHLNSFSGFFKLFTQTTFPLWPLRLCTCAFTGDTFGGPRGYFSSPRVQVPPETSCWCFGKKVDKFQNFHRVHKIVSSKDGLRQTRPGFCFHIKYETPYTSFLRHVAVFQN